MNIKGVLWRYKNKIVSWLNPVEWAFKKYFKEIDKVEGFLKSPKQERWFFYAARKVPPGGIIVEIGSYKGRSTVSFGYAIKGSAKKIYCIDTFNGNDVDFGTRDFFNDFDQNIKRNGLADYVIPCVGLSSEIAINWELPIDLLYIDGSHKYEDVFADWNNYFPYLKKGGIVAFHDVSPYWPGVMKVWEESAKLNLINHGNVSTLYFGEKP